MGNVRDYIKRMALKLSNHHFSGEDLIMVIDFLSRFVRDENIQEIFEAQTPVALPSFLKGFSRNQYEAGPEMVSPEEGGISSPP